MPFWIQVLPPAKTRANVVHDGTSTCSGTSQKEDGPLDIDIYIYIEREIYMYIHC